MDDIVIQKAREKISEFITSISLQGIGFNSKNIDEAQKQKFKSNYWGYIFSRIKRKENIKLDVIMCLVVNDDGSITLEYNPKMVLGLSNSHLLYVIEHEGLHLLNRHLPRMIKILNAEFDEKKKIMKSNLYGIAADCSVNVLGNLPKTLMINKEEYILCFPNDYNLPKDKTTEYYYNQLLKQELEKEKNSQNDNKNENSQNDNKDETKKQNEDIDWDDDKKDSNEHSKEKNKSKEKKKKENRCDNFAPSEEPTQLPENNIDSHNGWNSKEIINKDLLPKKIEDYVRNLISESSRMFDSKKGIGNLPGYMIDLINDVLKPPTLPYYQIIRNLVRGSRISKFKNCSSKINRKRMYVFFDQDGGMSNSPMISPFPGKKRDFSFSIVILIDTSGSMSKKELIEGLSGIKNMIENDKHCKVTVIENDTMIHKEYEVKRISDIDCEIKGRGGTQLKPGLLRAKELDCDVCLCFTDGEIDNINSIDRKSLPKKIIWAIPEKAPCDSFDKTGYIVRTIKDK